MSNGPGRCVPHQVHMDGSLLPVEGIEQKAAFIMPHQLIQLVAAGTALVAAPDTYYVNNLTMAANCVLPGGKLPRGHVIQVRPFLKQTLPKFRCYAVPDASTLSA